ncbi:TPA: phosphate uptake regulator PhoU [Methanosarcina acetivorans]|uniref:Phosphate regulatory protein-like protein n=2 Tax=Methanosarcina acetivorans TaxID=2214 RepID=Q8TLE8_METAC|nr:phosphate uptake regulator PhoU [Methanosarcina acetivorans]AAM06461.1 phosphate regulatory protein-like protein [Methanosarcina acetivorans C2A]HIH95659.1 phosphate uptake regulator PhoU [Methanosarcina acetivorans]
METRKVQVTGKSTYILTLPKKWVTKSALGAGSSVNLSYQEDGSLVISPLTIRKPTASRRLVMKESGDELKRNIIGTYIMGNCQFLEISGIGDQQEIKNEIKELCKVLIGFEIIEIDGSRVLIQDILDTDEFTIEAGFKRMSSLVFLMFNDLMEIQRTRTPENIRDIIARDEDVDKIFFLLSKLFISRLNLRKTSKKDRLRLIEAFYYRLAAGELERIGNLIVKIVHDLERASFSGEEKEKLLEFGLFTRLFVQDSVNSLRLLDIELANNLLQEKENFRAELLELTGPATDPALEIITDSFGRVKDYARNIAKLTIDLSQL